MIIKDKNRDQWEVEGNECSQQEKCQIGSKYLLFTYENVINEKNTILCNKYTLAEAQLFKKMALSRGKVFLNINTEKEKIMNLTT